MKTYKFKLYRSRRNKHLNEQINVAGIIYNHCIALHKRHYRLYGKHLHKFRLQRHLTKMSHKPKYEFWKKVPSQVRETITEDIHEGYQRFFDKTAKYPPGFKKVSKRKSFRVKKSSWKFLDGNKIRINKRVYRYFKSREVEGNIKTVTVKRDTLGDFFICVVTDYEEKNPTVPNGNRSVGLDFGLKTFLTTNDGDHIESPLFYKQSRRKLAVANRKLSRKVKGSNNREKARKDVARVHRKITNQRLDHHFKLAANLVKENAVVCIEDLNLTGMTKLWGRKVNDLAFSQFVILLKHQALKTGSEVVEIDRFYPSTKTCSSCGSVNDKLTLRDREWTCGCGVTHDRDVNAAINIHKVGMSTLA